MWLCDYALEVFFPFWGFVTIISLIPNCPSTSEFRLSCRTALLPIHLTLKPSHSSGFFAQFRVASVSVNQREDGRCICVRSMPTWISVNFEVKTLPSTFNIMILYEPSITLMILPVFQLHQQVPGATSKWTTLRSTMPPEMTISISICDLHHCVILRPTTRNTIL